jgi:putative DNA primase/helicase
MSTTFSQEELDIRKATISKLINKPALVIPFLIEELERVVLFGKSLYVFNGVHYEYMDPNVVSRIIFNFFLKYGVEDKYSASKDKEFLHLMSVSPQVPRVTNFDDYENMICVRNGVLDLSTYLLHPHSPDFYFTYFVDVDYMPAEIDCPTFMRFLQGLFASSGSWEEGYRYNEDMVENVLRLGGYILHPQLTMEKLFLFLGTGSNGKSMMLDIFKSLYPQKFTTSLSLSTIAQESSAERIQLMTSRLNIASESRGDAVDAEEIKKIVSGEAISIKRKFMDPIDIKPKTKLIIASNSMPYFNDTSYGINRRLTIFSFKNRFVPATDLISDKIIYNRSNIYAQIPKTILWDALEREKSAILNQFLDALLRLKDDKWQFVDCADLNAAIDEYKEGADTLGNWLASNFKYDANSMVELSAIFEEYRQYYYENFGDKKFNYSTSSLSRKIKEMYRVESLRVKGMGDRGLVRTTVFNLVKYDKYADKESDEILIRLESARDIRAEQGGSPDVSDGRDNSGGEENRQASIFSPIEPDSLSPDLTPKVEGTDKEGAGTETETTSI